MFDLLSVDFGLSGNFVRNFDEPRFFEVGFSLVAAPPFMVGEIEPFSVFFGDAKFFVAQVVVPSNKVHGIVDILSTGK